MKKSTFYIHMSCGNFVCVDGFDYSNNYGLDLGLHYGDMPYGYKEDYKVWRKYVSGKRWIISDKRSGNAISIGRTKKEAISNVTSMIDCIGGVGELMKLANKSIEEYGIAPNFDSKYQIE